MKTLIIAITLTLGLAASASVTTTPVDNSVERQGCYYDMNGVYWCE